MCRWFILDRSGPDFKTGGLLDLVGPTNQLEEILERVGKNTRGFEARARFNRKCSKKSLLEESY